MPAKEYEHLEVSVSLPVPAAYKAALNAFTTVGFVQKQDENSGYISGAIRSGMLGLNAASITVSVEASGAASSMVTIDAHAVEGLIPQHSAEKAARKLADALTASAGAN